MSISEEIAHTVKNNINANEYLRSVLVELYLIGRRNNNKQTFKDIDFVFVIDSKHDIIDILHNITAILDKIMRTQQVFISIFPVNEHDFLCENTMFIKNVKRHGIRI